MHVLEGHLRRYGRARGAALSEAAAGEAFGERGAAGGRGHRIRGVMGLLCMCDIGRRLSRVGVWGAASRVRAGESARRTPFGQPRCDRIEAFGSRMSAGEPQWRITRQ